MSGKPRHEDPAAMVPVRFHKAFDAGALSFRQYALGLYLAEEAYIARPASGGIVTVRLDLLGIRFGNVSRDTISRDLRGMEDAGWIECEVSGGSHDGWRIWLTGLASPALPPHDLRTTSAKTPPVLRRWTSAETSAELEAQVAANAHDESDSALPEPPQEPPQSEVLPPGPEPEPEPEPEPNPGFENKREVLGSLRRGEDEISTLAPTLAELMARARRAAEANSEQGEAEAEAMIEDGTLIERPEP